MRVRSIVGINHDAVFGSTRAGWHPDLPDACREPFIPLLWVKILELLGRVPAGSTARFLQDGTLPVLTFRPLRRRGCTPGGDLFERSPVGFERHLLAGPLLPALHDDIAIPRI